MIQPVLLGGLFLGVLSALPIISAGNCCCLWTLGGVPQRHRTDHLSAAVRPLDAAGRAQASERYGALLRHYGLEPTTVESTDHYKTLREFFEDPRGFVEAAIGE